MRSPDLLYHNPAGGARVFSVKPAGTRKHKQNVNCFLQRRASTLSAMALFLFILSDLIFFERVTLNLEHTKHILQTQTAHGANEAHCTRSRLD